MRWKQFGLWILATALATGQIAAAQDPSSSPLFRQWVVEQPRIKFALVGGRVVNRNENHRNFGMLQQTSQDGPVREKATVIGNGAAESLTYTYQRSAQAGQSNDPRVAFAIELGWEGRFALRCSDKDHPDKYFNLTQVPGQPVSLSLPPSDKPRILRAATVWHLLIIHAEDCRKQVLPMLESIRPGWHLARTTQAIEGELLKKTAVPYEPDRKQWDAWVAQLGDPQFYTRRDRAERNLREVGLAVLGYMNRLDMSRLDAEQKSRVRRIIRFLSRQAGEDTPENVASLLFADPMVWLALLSRPEERTRQAAVKQLAVLLHGPVAVDPKAPSDSQAKARDELRSRIEKILGERSKSSDDAAPAGGNKVPGLSAR